MELRNLKFNSLKFQSFFDAAGIEPRLEPRQSEKRIILQDRDKAKRNDFHS